MMKEKFLRIMQNRNDPIVSEKMHHILLLTVGHSD